MKLATVKAWLLYARKAVAVLVFAEGAAVAEGLLSSGTAATITSVLGVLSSVLAFSVGNGPKPTKTEAPAPPASP